MKLEGIAELRAALEPKGPINKVKQVVKLNGAELQSKAQSAAPYRTGTLRRSVGLKIENGGMRAVVEAEAEYAPYVEYGTRFMQEQPYMKPSFNSQQAQFKRDLDRLDRR